MSKLSDLLLSSGFGNPYATDEDDRTMQALHDAILDALFNGGVLPEETIERLLGDPADGDQSDARNQLEELIQQIIERMGEQGYITAPPDLEGERQRRSGRGPGEGEAPAHFQVTDKTLDFLGYRALRDLLGSLGKSSFGRHDTREQATGVETTGAPKPYKFGDTLNLNPGSTLLNAVRREAREAAAGVRSARSSAASLKPGARSPIHVTHEDLMVVQGEYQSSCATVLMLDCSHSMIDLHRPFLPSRTVNRLHACGGSAWRHCVTDCHGAFGRRPRPEYLDNATSRSRIVVVQGTPST